MPSPSRLGGTGGGCRMGQVCPAAATGPYWPPIPTRAALAVGRSRGDTHSFWAPTGSLLRSKRRGPGGRSPRTKLLYMRRGAQAAAAPASASRPLARRKGPPSLPVPGLPLLAHAHALTLTPVGARRTRTHSGGGGPLDWGHCPPRAPWAEKPGLSLGCLPKAPRPQLPAATAMLHSPLRHRGKLRQGVRGLEEGTQPRGGAPLLPASAPLGGQIPLAPKPNQAGLGDPHPSVTISTGLVNAVGLGGPC